MERVQLVNMRTGNTVGYSIWKATTFWSRLRGLLGRKEITPGEGLWLNPCRQVHMLGMRYPISVWFIDETGTVCAIIDELAMGKISPIYHDARSVLEFPAGWAKVTDTRKGDKITQPDLFA